MDIGIPRQKRPFEYRVGLTPMGVRILTESRHRCYVESGAGQGSGFDDDRYRQAGAQIVYSTEEVYGRSDMLLSVSRPTIPEFDLLHEGHILCGFLNLAVSHPKKIETMLARRVTAIGYETIQDDDGCLPVLSTVSQIAGRMVASIAADLLQNHQGGHGLLLGGVPGVPPSKVVILGAGVVGQNAARMLQAAGADVFLLDTNLRKLEEVEGRCWNVKTMVAYDFNIARAVREADVLVGAVLVPGARSPHVVTRDMVRGMKPRSVIIDVSIDQGGCIETSRPTTYQNPTYIEEDVIHYCVPNMTGVVARTTTHAFLNAAWPYVQEIADRGLQGALDAHPELRRGLNIHDGEIVHPALRGSLDALERAGGA